MAVQLLPSGGLGQACPGERKKQGGHSGRPRPTYKFSAHTETNHKLQFPFDGNRRIFKK
jgi:hypothetical protein